MKIKKSILVTVSMLILSCQNIPNNITKNPISKSQNLSEKDDINIGVLSWKEVNECYSSSGCKPTYDKLLSSSEEVINVNCSCDNNAKLLKTRFTIDEPICDNQNTFTVTALTQEQKDNLKYLRDLFKIFREVDKINQYQYEITKTYNQAYYTEVITSTQNFSLYTYLSNQLRHKGQVNTECI